MSLSKVSINSFVKDVRPDLSEEPTHGLTPERRRSDLIQMEKLN